MKPSKFFCVLAVAAAPSFFFAGGADANVVLTFSEPDFEWGAFGGNATEYHIWTAGDFWRQNFTSTGLASATNLVLNLDIDDAAFEPLNLDVFINSVDVGDLVLEPGDFGVTTFEFSFAPIAGDSYFIEVVASSTIPGGQGSYSIFLDDGLSTATLIPEPATLVLLGLGLAGGGFARRNKTRRVSAPSDSPR